MALTHARCKAGLTLGGGAVSGYNIFDGEGYCKVFNKTIGGMDYRLYGRAHSYDSNGDTISISMYLFGAKNNDIETKDTTGNYASKVTFTCGGQTIKFTSSDKRLVLKADGTAVLLGTATVENVSLSPGAKAFKAVWTGPNGTSLEGEHTISETMYWNKKNASDATPVIAISQKTTTSWTAKVSNLRTERNCLTSWVWNRKNTTTSADWTDGMSYSVAQNSTNTSHTQDYSGALAGNSYTVKFTCWLRNYNTDKGTSTKKAPLWNVTTTLTTNKNTTQGITPSKTTVEVQVNKTVQLTLSSDSTGSFSVTTDSTSIASAATSGTKNATVTITGKAVGTTYLNATVSGATAYTDKTVDNVVTINVVRNKSATIPTVQSLTYNGSSQTGVRGGNYVTVAGGGNATDASVAGTGSTISNNKATGAGNYTWSATPVTGYAWSDGTYAAKTGSWTIARATDNWTIPPTATVQVGKTITISVSGNDSGITPKATSSNPSVARVSDSATGVNGTFTITGVAEGTATITASTAASANFNAHSPAGCVVTVTGKTVGIADWGTTLSQPMKETQSGTVTLTRTHTGGNLASKETHDKKIVSVKVASPTATITAVGVGTTTVSLYATGTSTYTDSTPLNIPITVGPAELTLGTKTVPLYVGDKPVRRIYKGTTLIL
jgi:hypothetical protein